MVEKNSSSEEPRDEPFKHAPRGWRCQAAGAATPAGNRAIHAVTSVGATFQWLLRVYWEDTDAGGIVFYANYLKFFERARTEWLRSLGIEQQALKAHTGGMFVVADTEVRYRRPARLDDSLWVTATLTESGRASMTIFQQAYLKPNNTDNAETLSKSELLSQSTQAPKPNTDTLLCEGSIRIGWVNAQSLQPCRIPAHVLLALRGQT